MGKIFNSGFRYTGSEIMDNQEELGYPMAQKVYNHLSRLNRIIGTDIPTLNFIRHYLNSHDLGNKPIRLMDVGCGNGSKLRKIEKLAAKRKVKVDLLGIDISPYAIQAAKESTGCDSYITFLNSDIDEVKESFDVVLYSNMLYHLTDDDIVHQLSKAKSISKVVFANELLRSRLSVLVWYLLCYTLLIPFGPIIRKDGFISIAKGFKQVDWKKYAQLSGLKIIVRKQLNLTWGVQVS